MDSDASLKNAENRKCFPIDYYLRSIVRILDIIKYNDHNFTSQERRDKLHYAYTKAAKHFAQPKQQCIVKDMERIQFTVETSSKFVVYSYSKLSYEAAADFTTLVTYLILHDDWADDPSESLKNLFNNMQAGKPQDNVLLRLINEQTLPEFLGHYNSYCAFNIYRSIMDCKYYTLENIYLFTIYC